MAPHLHRSLFLGVALLSAAWAQLPPSLPMKSVQVLGATIRYHEAGSGDRNVILLHGLGGDATNWAANVAAFSARYHVFVPDQVGFGTSDKPFLNYRVATMVDFLDGFYRQVGIARATLVGNSLGGWISAAYALAHPDKVDRIVLVDSAGLALANVPREVLLTLNPSTVGQMKQVLNLILANKALVTDAAAEQAFARRMKNNDGYTINAFVDSVLRKEDVLDTRLASVTTPTLIVWGRQDALTPIELGNRMHQGIKGSEIVTLDACGHVPQMECAPRFNETVLNWLAK